MENMNTCKTRFEEGELTIILHELNWDIVKNERKELLELSYTLVMPDETIYTDELYICADNWDIGADELTYNNIVYILNTLGKRHRLWHGGERVGCLPFDNNIKKVKLWTDDAGKLSKDSIYALGKLYFGIPLEIV